MKKILYFIFASLVLFGCKPNLDPEETSLGDVNPSVFVAIGGTSLSGFTNDALSLNGQQNSIPSIIATQLNGLQTVMFNQPLLSNASLGVNLDSLSQLVLGYKTDCNSVTSLSPVRFAAQGYTGAFSETAQWSNHNVSVPYLSFMSTEMAGYGNPANGVGLYNPFFSRFAMDQVNSSVLSDALALNPTFFMVDLGQDDIMAYAKSGGETVIPPVSGAAGFGFDGSLNSIVTALKANGANGVISTIPNIHDFPYFTLIPYDGLNLDAANAATMNSVFNPLGITFQEGPNGFTVSDPTEPFGVRKLVDGELICLSIPLDSVKCYGMGSIVPIPAHYVLDLAEVAEIQSKIDAYNSIILSVASTYNLGVADLNSLYNSLNSGAVYNGISMSYTFVSGGYFSLDGRNLTARGNALVANEYIKAMNKQFNAHIPYASVSKYPGLVFP